MMVCEYVASQREMLKPVHPGVSIGDANLQKQYIRSVSNYLDVWSWQDARLVVHSNTKLGPWRFLCRNSGITSCSPLKARALLLIDALAVAVTDDSD